MRILIVRLSSLGDIVHAAPSLADIRRALPGAVVDWVVEEAFVPLVEGLAGVERVVPIALRRWRSRIFRSWGDVAAFRRVLREQRYDAVIDLQGLVKSAVVARWAQLAPGGARHGLANRTDGAAYEPLARLAYAHRVAMPARIHVVDRSRRLAAEALGYVVDGPPRVQWRLPTDAAVDSSWGNGRSVLLVHGSAKPVKLVPTGFWIDLGKALAAEGCAVLLAWGTPVERERAIEIAAGIGAAASVPERLTLGPLLAAIARLRGCIGLDTGLTHIAATLGLPTVQVFIEQKAWRAGIYWQPQTVVLQADDGALPAVAQVMAAWRRACRDPVPAAAGGA
ncbi:MAG: lipopolysaccharide heptosyltransferase I [Caldimonas sp.]